MKYLINELAIEACAQAWKNMVDQLEGDARLTLMIELRNPLWTQSRGLLANVLAAHLTQDPLLEQLWNRAGEL